MLKHLVALDRLLGREPAALFAPSPTDASRDDVTSSDRSQHAGKLHTAWAIRGSPRTTTRPRSTLFTERHKFASSPERSAGHSEQHRAEILGKPTETSRRHTDDVVRSTFSTVFQPRHVAIDPLVRDAADACGGGLLFKW